MTIDRSIEEPCEVTSLTHGFEAERRRRLLRLGSALLERLKAVGLPVECGSGGLTKFHRTTRGLPKNHWLDVACVGKSTPVALLNKGIVPLYITATGHGRRQICSTDKYGFPKQHKERKKKFLGYQTGDMVKALTPRGTFEGRIAIRHRPSFRLGKADIHPKYMWCVHRSDGYEYRQKGVRYAPMTKARGTRMARF
ncbi:hypothetical protein KSB_94800 [Ktedonobacter robiniae]|uniref:HNH endonuclease n=1 Tax=Ktedonobacter robiniae TaxID=2778365 RepID=A0ABQ3V825_9CHLR|nr:hypothetical protein KSB_94800 [Ktedonobacter robiniae]